MAKYLVRASYTRDGVQGLLKEGATSRRDAVEQMVNQADGTLETFYYAMGETDVFAIVDVPDSTTVAAISLAVNAAGAVTLSSTPLLTAEEMDEACKRSVNYRPPGT